MIILLPVCVIVGVTAPRAAPALVGVAGVVGIVGVEGVARVGVEGAGTSDGEGVTGTAVVSAVATGEGGGMREEEVSVIVSKAWVRCEP